MRVPGGAGRRFTMPWELAAGHRLDWSLRLNSEIPLSLDVETGASETRMDLSGLRVTELWLRTGASASELTLPSEAGATRAEIRSGMASVTVRVPLGVAARIRAKSGLAAVTVDQSRFPRAGDGYQSPDYGTATNKVDIDIETGVGSVDVR